MTATTGIFSGIGRGLTGVFERLWEQRERMRQEERQERMLGEEREREERLWQRRQEAQLQQEGRATIQAEMQHRLQRGERQRDIEQARTYEERQQAAQMSEAGRMQLLGLMGQGATPGAFDPADWAPTGDPAVDTEIQGLRRSYKQVEANTTLRADQQERVLAELQLRARHARAQAAPPQEQERPEQQIARQFRVHPVFGPVRQTARGDWELVEIPQMRMQREQAERQQQQQQEQRRQRQREGEMYAGYLTAAQRTRTTEDVTGQTVVPPMTDPQVVADADAALAAFRRVAGIETPTAEPPERQRAFPPRSPGGAATPAPTTPQAGFAPGTWGARWGGVPFPAGAPAPPPPPTPLTPYETKREMVARRQEMAESDFNPDAVQAMDDMIEAMSATNWTGSFNARQGERYHAAQARLTAATGIARPETSRGVPPREQLPSEPATATAVAQSRLSRGPYTGEPSVRTAPPPTLQDVYASFLRRHNLYSDTQVCNQLWSGLQGAASRGMPPENYEELLETLLSDLRAASRSTPTGSSGRGTSPGRAPSLPLPAE